MFCELRSPRHAASHADAWHSTALQPCGHDNFQGQPQRIHIGTFVNDAATKRPSQKDSLYRQKTQSHVHLQFFKKSF